MNKRTQYTTLFTMLFAIFSVYPQQDEYTGKIHVTPLSLEQKGDSLYIKILYDISGINVDSDRSISLFPSLVSPQKSVRLPEVMIKGRTNYKVYKREMSLMSVKERIRYNSKAPYAVVKGYIANDTKKIQYYQAIPYETWMADARLDIQEDLCGCGAPPRTLILSQFLNSIRLHVSVPPYHITPYPAYIMHDIELLKPMEMMSEAYLDFEVSKTNIRPDYMNNSHELKKITDMIDKAKNNPDIIIRSISVIGYASPEGTYSLNQKLSENRADALINYLAPRFNYPISMYKVKFGGENWAGLKELVKQSDISEKQLLMDIIDNININRNAVISQINGGNLYRYILKEFYPSLRKATCKIDYEIKELNIAEAKGLIKTQPQKLSLNEMLQLANTFGKESQEFFDIIETAVRIYPDNLSANLNAAATALDRNDIISAELYLSKVQNSSHISEYENNMGILAMLKGDYDQAEILLKSALAGGVEAAKSNLEELAKKRESISLKE